MRTLLLLLPVALVFQGCSSEEGGETAAEAPQKAAPATPATVPAVAEAEVQLTGTTGCGHCTFKTVDHCTAAITTADGTVYILEDVAEDSELFTERYDGKEIRVVGVSRVEDDVHYVTVKSYEM